MWFWNKKHTIAASGILQGAVDHHSHILPGVDDGVETMDEALRILAAYEDLGIKELWITPHIMEDIPNTPQKLKARFEELKAAYKGNIKLHLAAEYMIDNHLRKLLNTREGDKTNNLRHSQCEGRWQEQSEVTEGSKAPNGEGDKTSESQGKILLINNCPSCVRGASNAVAEGAPPLLPIGNAGKHILVETSYYNAPMRMNDTLQQIKSLGYFPLLAHPERYMHLNNADYTRLHSQGVRFQLNLASLAGGYGKAVKKKAEWLLSNGLYSVVGSDLHCEDAIEYITNCKLSKQAVEQIEKLLHNSIQNNIGY